MRLLYLIPIARRGYSLVKTGIPGFIRRGKSASKFLGERICRPYGASILRIPLRHFPGGANGFRRSGDPALTRDLCKQLQFDFALASDGAPIFPGPEIMLVPVILCFPSNPCVCTGSTTVSHRVTTLFARQIGFIFGQHPYLR